MLRHACLASLADCACNALVSAGLRQLRKNFRSQKNLGISRVTSVCPSETRDWEGTRIIEGHPHCIAVFEWCEVFEYPSPLFMLGFFFFTLYCYEY